MKQKEIGIIGIGYVGLVTGACLAKLGHKVICADIDKEKVEKLKTGYCPIHEEGLPEILKEAINNGNLDFTSENKELVDKSSVIFVCVGTPENDDGSADLSYVYDSCIETAKNMEDEKIIVIKSTVPVTSLKLIEGKIRQNTDTDFSFASNPEFLAQGSAVNDFMNPARVVIGADDDKTKKELEDIYESMNAQVVLTNVASAVMIKYASNTFLATKISFINTIANFCEKVGADIEEVANGMGYDKRIGSLFLRAGIGYGGSCFPKDTKALYHQSKEVGCDLNLIKEVINVNEAQRQVVIEKLKKHLGDLKDKKIAVLGLAFKPKTDDLREAPSVYIINDLMKEGSKISAYDPVIKSVSGLNGLDIKDDVYKSVEGADALLVVTDYPEFKDLDIKKIASLVNNKIIVDGRNIMPKEELKSNGFSYSSIGRNDD